MTLKGGNNQACAACKYQRRKCTSTCPLAPYFPPDQHKMFQNVHKLFGVKKIQKLLKLLHPSQHNEAMSSIIYQANIRERSPVYGCVEVIQHLRNQIRQCEEELYAVHSMLNTYRHQHDHQQISTNVVSFTDINSASQLQLGMGPPSNIIPSFYNQNTAVLQQHYNSENVVPLSQNHSYSSSSSPYHSSYLDVKEPLLNSMWIQHPGIHDNTNSENENAIPIQSELVITSESPAFQENAFQDYNDMHPYFDTIDDRQSYIDSKVAYDSR
ncbi:hypothetical protein BVRB_5g115440 [Beta vulgaris subsp. vulgaris]|nr:hypothetical protein BVRB_5g115440 [Beta vulgaris subsp. vulgaris]